MKQTLPILADIANGIFAVLIAGYFYDTSVSWWYFIVGVLVAMCPDIDALPELLRRGRVGASKLNVADHREFLHFPIVFLLLGILLAYNYGFWGAVFLIATLLHFINDLYGTGWGVPVFGPFKGRRFKVLGRRVNRLKSMLIEDGTWNELSDSERRLKYLVTWSPEELHDYISRYGDDKWVDRWYLRLNWISGLEYALFFTAMVLLIVTLVY